MNVDLHLSRLSSFGFTHLLGLVPPLSGKPAQIFKYGSIYFAISSSISLGGHVYETTVRRTD